MERNDFIEVWPHIVLFDLLRYLIPAGIAFVLFWVIGKNWWRHRFIQINFPKSNQLWKEFAYSMSTVIIFSLVGFGIHTAAKEGLTRVYHDLDQYGMVYMFFSLVVAIVFHDFYFYWTHRLMHHRKIFKHVHRVHHESTNPSPWAAYSFHPWEALIQAMVLPIMIFTLPLHPLSIFLFLTYMIVRNVIGHLGFEILPKGFTKNKWFNWNTAITHHSMHHEHFNSNYGLYFTWWDKLMKTEHAKYHETFNEVKSRTKVCQLKKARKSVILAMIGSLVITGTYGQSTAGRWTTYNEQTGSPISVIEIKEADGSLEGNVIKVFTEPYQGEDPICSKCLAERKGQKIIGMNFLWGFKPDGDAWTLGKILDPESGEIYSGKLWLEDANTLHVRGYAGPLDLFYRTQTWRRERTASHNTPVGTWHTIDDRWNEVKSVVEIKNVSGELKGFIRKIYLMPNEGTDPICTACKGEYKNSKIVGMKIIWGFERDGDKWVNGKILDPASGNVYASSMSLIGPDTLKVRGYLGPFFRSQVWRRTP